MGYTQCGVHAGGTSTDQGLQKSLSHPHVSSLSETPNYRTPASGIVADGGPHVYLTRLDLPVPSTVERCGPRADGH